MTTACGAGKSKRGPNVLRSGAVFRREQDGEVTKAELVGLLKVAIKDLLDEGKVYIWYTGRRLDLEGVLQRLDGEEPKGEVMATREELAELVSEKIKGLVSAEGMTLEEIDRAARLTSILQVLESAPPQMLKFDSDPR